MSEQEFGSEAPDIILIPDEDGNEAEYEIILAVELDETGNQYVFIIPVESDEGSDEEDDILAFRFTEDEDGLVLYPIDDEDEWNLVEEAFNALVAQEEDQV